MADGTAVGIVLAGGKSSRMGQNKALMDYQGTKLVEYMANLLRQAGCIEVHISGDVPGYQGIPDVTPHEGPARAMTDLLGSFKGRREKLLFVPVDMPLIQVNSLRHLLAQNGNVCYRDYPLPACLMAGDFSPCGSVKELLAAAGARPLDIPLEWEKGMVNINTRKEWEELAS